MTKDELSDTVQARKYFKEKGGLLNANQGQLQQKYSSDVAKSRVFFDLPDLAHTPALERSKKGGFGMRATRFQGRKSEYFFHRPMFCYDLVACTV